MRKTLRARIRFDEHGGRQVIPCVHLHPETFSRSYGNLGQTPIPWEVAEACFEFDYDAASTVSNCMESWLRHYNFRVIFKPGDVLDTSHDEEMVFPDDPIE